MENARANKSSKKIQPTKAVTYAAVANKGKKTGTNTAMPSADEAKKAKTELPGPKPDNTSPNVNDSATEEIDDYLNETQTPE